MTENNHIVGTPNRSHRGGAKYDLLRESHKAAMDQTIPTPIISKELFTMTLTVSSEEDNAMNEEQKFLIKLIFKPNANGLKLRPAETQLLLAHIGEILKEIEVEETSVEKGT